MQDPDRTQVFAVVCRQAGSSVQVLLHKVGRGPPTEKRWAFIGGTPQPGEDGGVRARFHWSKWSRTCGPLALRRLLALACPLMNSHTRKGPLLRSGPSNAE